MQHGDPWILSINSAGFNSLGAWLERDEEHSTFDLSRLFGEDEIGEECRGYFKISGPRWRQAEKLHILPYAVSTPIVSDELKEAVCSNVPVSEIDFFPVTVWHASGTEWRRWVLRPLIRKECVDFSNSKIKKWLVPDYLILFSEKMRFKNNCLGEHKIVRNGNYTSQILFSESLKSILEKYLNGGFVFLRDIDLDDEPLS